MERRRLNLRSLVLSTRPLPPASLRNEIRVSGDGPPLVGRNRHKTRVQPVRFGFMLSRRVISPPSYSDAYAAESKKK